MILQKWKNKTASSCQQSMDFFNRRMSFYIECKIKFSRHRSRKDSSHYMPSFTWYEYRIYMTEVWWSRTLNFEELMFDVVPCWLLIAIPCIALLYSLLVECIFSKKEKGKKGEKKGKKKVNEYWNKYSYTYSLVFVGEAPRMWISQSMYIYIYTYIYIYIYVCIYVCMASSQN